MDWGGFWYVVALAGGVVIWAVRQEGRLNAHDKMIENQDKRHDEHVIARERMRQEMLARHQEIRADLAYVRDRIDRALTDRP